MKAISRSIRRGRWIGSLVLLLCLTACLPRFAEERSGKFSLLPGEACEPSGVVFDGTHCIFVNDKPIPGRSSVFKFPFRGGDLAVESREDLSSPLFREARKWEDVARTPDGKFFLAVTAFDRPDPAYNHLVAWPAGRPEAAFPVSGAIREGISEALRGAAYFKIEGLSCYPGNTLLFGIRAMGRSWKESSTVRRIVSVSYGIEGGEIRLGSDFEPFEEADYDPLLENAGISGLEFDFDAHLLYILFSVEKKEGMAGYLGCFRYLGSGLFPGPDGTPFRFPRKPEGITVLDRRRFLVVYDDDRVESAGRKKHEAVYTIFRWE